VSKKASPDLGEEFGFEGALPESSFINEVMKASKSTIEAKDNS